MAKIVPSDLAPSEKLFFSLGSGSFELNASNKTAAYETDDPALLADARSHPWLEVKVEKADLVEGLMVQRIDPKDDPMSSQHENARLALDPEAARAALPKPEEFRPVAIQAGLDQDKKVETAGVAETVAAAADASAETKEKK